MTVSGASYAYQSTKVYMYDGRMLDAVVEMDEWGLQITLPLNLYVFDIPQSQFITIEISLDATLWPETQRFPCRQSTMAPGITACDYFVHGWQTVPGNAGIVIPTSPDVPQCCPEGAVVLQGTPPSGECNTYLSDAPWRLEFDSNNTLPTSSAFTFHLQPTGTRPMGTPDCTSTNVDALKLYIDAAMAASLSNVVVRDMSVRFELRTDPMLYVSIPTGVPSGGPATEVQLQFAAQVGVNDVCTLKLGTHSVCNYQLEGSTGTCCTRGDVFVQ